MNRAQRDFLGVVSFLTHMIILFFLVAAAIEGSLLAQIAIPILLISGIVFSYIKLGQLGD